MCPTRILGYNKMKTLFSFLFVVATMFMFTSCDFNVDTPSSMYHKYESLGKTTEEKEAKKEHSDMFYAKMMDNFCRNHLEECFGVKYFSNSVQVIDLVRLDDRVLVEGIHSYKGQSTHRDVAFSAEIKEKDGHLFDVKFTKDKEGLFGKSGSESQTLTNIYYNG